MNREMLKTLTLSILVIISIVLIQRLWFPSPIDTLKTKFEIHKNSHVTAVEERKNIISPKTITVSFGAGDRTKNYYTVLTADDMDYVWEQSRDILKDFFSKDPQITRIGYDAYVQANTLKSVELEFGDNIPAILIASIFDSLDNNIVKNIRTIKKISVPAFNQGVIYITGNGEDEIYEISLHDYEENTVLIGFIDELEDTDYIKYHPICSLFDELDEGHTVVPINYTLNTEQILVESEIDTEKETALRRRSKSFFDGNFDFVKTIKETSGSVVYIYGYGERSLRISNKGILEYKEEIRNISSTDILTSLDVAIDFIYKNGGFPENTYLEGIRVITNDRNKGYQFLFGYRIGGLPVEFNRDVIEYPLKIEVYGNKVKVYRNLIRRAVGVQEINHQQDILYFPNIIEKNIGHLELQYSDDEKRLWSKMADEEKILQILKDIEEVRLVYFDAVEKRGIQSLKPGWMIKFKNSTFYFDSYTGKLIKKHVFD